MRLFQLPPSLNTPLQRHVVERVCIGANLISQVGVQFLLDNNRSGTTQAHVEAKAQPEPTRRVLAKP